MSQFWGPVNYVSRFTVFIVLLLVFIVRLSYRLLHEFCLAVSRYSRPVSRLSHKLQPAYEKFWLIFGLAGNFFGSSSLRKIQQLSRSLFSDCWILNVVLMYFAARDLLTDTCLLQCQIKQYANEAVPDFEGPPIPIYAVMQA